LRKTVQRAFFAGCLSGGIVRFLWPCLRKVIRVSLKTEFLEIPIHKKEGLYNEKSVKKIFFVFLFLTGVAAAGIEAPVGERTKGTAVTFDALTAVDHRVIK
jgi:hypothetical protein